MPGRLSQEFSRCVQLIYIHLLQSHLVCIIVLCWSVWWYTVHHLNEEGAELEEEKSLHAHVTATSLWHMHIVTKIDWFESIKTKVNIFARSQASSTETQTYIVYKPHSSIISANVTRINCLWRHMILIYRWSPVGLLCTLYSLLIISSIHFSLALRLSRHYCCHSSVSAFRC